MSKSIKLFDSWTTFSDPNNNIHNVHQVFITPVRPGPTMAVCSAHGVTAQAAIEVQKRARLMAAAPDLLAALIDVVGDDESLQNPWRVAARAAIAKATGETS